jgi:hypothetical protein
MMNFMTCTVPGCCQGDKGDEMGGACSRCGGEGRHIENFSQKYARPRHKRQGNIKMYLREIVWESVNWINLAQNITSAGIAYCEPGNKHLNSIKCGEFLD